MKDILNIGTLPKPKRIKTAKTTAFTPKGTVDAKFTPASQLINYMNHLLLMVQKSGDHHAEVGSLSTIIYGVSYIPGGWEWDF